MATHTNMTYDRINLCPLTGEELSDPDAILAFFLKVRLDGRPALTADDDDDGLPPLTARQRAELAALIADARRSSVGCSIHHH